MNLYIVNYAPPPHPSISLSLSILFLSFLFSISLSMPISFFAIFFSQIFIYIIISRKKLKCTHVHYM